MNQTTINRFEHDLRQLEQRFRFTAGQTAFDREGAAFLQGWPEVTPVDPNRYRITLGRNMRATGEVRHLPCGLIRSDGAVAAAAWTNELGQVDFCLPKGECALRYVWNIQAPIDAEILATLADDLALAYLQDCLEDEDLPVPLRERVRAAVESLSRLADRDRNNPLSRVAQPKPAILEIARVFAEFHQANAGQEDIQPIAAPALRRLDDARHDAWRCRATVGAAQAAEVHEALAAYAADDGPQPATDERWVHVQGDEVWLRFPAELVPYGVVRLLATTEDLLVGTCLVPLIKAKAVRYSQCPASWVVGDRDPRTLDWYAQPATVETLPWFAAGEVEALLQRADVRDHEELAGKVRELLELAQQREAEVSHDGI